MPAIRRYTKFVALSKSSLWVLVAVVLGVLLWISSDMGGDKGARIVFSSGQHGEDVLPVMIKPHYQGVDANNQPYTVIADTAVQRDPNTIDLKTLTADMLQTSGRWMALNSKTGVLNTQKKEIELMGGVNMFTNGGYEFRTDHAHVDLQKGNAVGDSHVEGQGLAGTLLADSFSVDGKAHIIHFNGSVIMRLYH